MVYLIVFIALLVSAIKGYCGKKASTYVAQPIDAVLFNSLRMMICILIGIALVFLDGARAYLLPERGMLLICILAGVSNSMFLIGWMLAVRQNALVTVDVSLTLGSLIPSILCALLFAEPLSLPKMLGFALIVVATVILAKQSKSGKKHNKRRVIGFLLLLAAVVGEGMTSFSQQLYKHFYTEGGARADGVFYPKTIYHFYTYVISALTLCLVLLIYKLVLARKARQTDVSAAGGKLLQRLPLRVLGLITVMAISIFAANYLQTVATSDYGMPSQILYPILKGGSLISTNLVAMIFFGEKITRRSVLGSLIALAGMLLMNVL